MTQEHYSSPSVGFYTVFNEGWGQFDTQRMVQLGHELDSSRLWDAASGWIDPQDRPAYPPGGDINKPGPWFYHYTGYVRPPSLYRMSDTCISKGSFSSQNLLASMPRPISICSHSAPSLACVKRIVDSFTWAKLVRQMRCHRGSVLWSKSVCTLACKPSRCNGDCSVHSCSFFRLEYDDHDLPPFACAGG